jgi:hypothetical protein
VDVVRAAAAADPRVRLVHATVDAPPLGAAGSFAWLLERLPADAEYIMCADQDDVWLPQKIERTLLAMSGAESTVNGGAAVPILVHTDLVVVDAELREIDSSFWHFAGIQPEPPTLRRLIVRNVTTGAAVMMNRALRELVGAAPREAIFHDWWYAIVAAALGRIVAVPESTALYRQHDANVVGARDWRLPVRDLPGAMVAAVDRTHAFRRGIKATADQARALYDRYRERLRDDDRRFLAAYARIPERGFLRRKLDLLRFRTLPEHGVLRNLGVLLRG